MSSYKKIRISVRSICIHDGKMLFQMDSNDKIPFYATVGGELEPGEILEDRLKLEYIEETGMEIEIVKYLFVIENFLVYNGQPIHSMEHYFLVNINSHEFSSLEENLSFHWLPMEGISEYDIKPQVLKNLLIKGDIKNTKHLVEKGDL